MPPTALTYAYTNRDWIESLLSIEGVELNLDDDGDIYRGDCLRWSGAHRHSSEHWALHCQTSQSGEYDRRSRDLYVDDHLERGRQRRRVRHGRCGLPNGRRSNSGEHERSRLYFGFL